MPKIGVTTYDLLISCPSDVKSEIQIIKDVVESFNNLFGQANNIQVVTKHWSKNSYPESGGKPQSLLNKQFVFDCDAAVAVFWTRFGTPTEEYGSGTEEEIEELIKSGKQVFLYFCDTPINPSTINSEQYNKVNDFKEKYKDKGVYGSYSDITQFKTDFLNHLTLYFLDILKSTSPVAINKNVPRLVLYGVYHEKPSTKLNIIHKDWLSRPKFKTFETKIRTLFNDIENINLPKPPTEEQLQTLSVSDLKAKNLNIESSFENSAAIAAMIGLNLYPISIDEEIISLIELYAKETDIKLSNYFFYIANLKKSKNLMPTVMGGGEWSLSGSDAEEDKYMKIMKLYDLIVEYKQFNNYFSKLSSMSYVEICISNIGTTFDEDIDVYLKIEKNIGYASTQLPIPEDEIIEQFNEDLIIKIFKPKQNVSINEYAYYPVHDDSPLIYSTPVSPLFYSKSRQDEIDEAKEEYLQIMEDLFCYDIYEDDIYDILHFNLKYLKQNISMFIPTYLHFNTLPDIIKYEIKSKYSSDVVEGTLSF